MEIANILVNSTTGRCLTRKQIPARLVGGTVSVEFADSIWDRLNKTVVFRCEQSQPAEFDGKTAVIPWELLQQPGKRLYFGIWGNDPASDLQIPLIEVPIGVVEASTDPDATPGADPTLPIWAQLQNEIEDLKKAGVSEEKIAQVVEEYLKKNPPTVTETDPTVPDWAKNEKKPTYTADEVGALSKEELSGAVSDALAQAKASGEFDGEPGAPGQDYVLTEDDKIEIAEMAADLVEIPDFGGNADQVSVEPAEDDIPKIFFGGALQQTKDEAVVPFRYISKTDDFSGYTEIKAQGNSSMNYAKKNQTVKMFADEACETKLKKDFKGWGKQNKHVYKANWIDLSHSRNVVSARLWADVVKSRANYAELPELLRTTPNQGAVDGFPVKVYADGVYQGRYTLNIPKDKWAFNMDDELDTHCVLCGENYASGCFRASAQINEYDWTDEIHDTVPASIKTRWNDVISFVMNSTDEDFRTNLSQYFYVDSLIDYYLFGLASCGLDAFGKNQIYATYDGQKWIASMYDMDSTWGLYWNGSKFVSASYGRNEYEDMVQGRQGNLLYIRLEQLFWSELQTRWTELKNGALSIVNIINRFERFTDIAPAELVKEDYASTTGGGKFTGIPSQTTNNIQQIRAFALARQAWTDEYVASLTPEVEVPCTGISLNTNTLTFTAEGSQTLTATVTPDGCTDEITWESDNTSVATVSGGVVTAIANGSATITAKCGEYSASCSVAISGISEEKPDEPVDGLLYSLPSATTFNGTSDYIDTGIKLYDEEKDITIFLDFTFGTGTTKEMAMAHCMHESAQYPGFVAQSMDERTWMIDGVACKKGALARIADERHKVCMRLNTSTKLEEFYIDGTTLTVSGTYSSFTPITENLLLGCYQVASGNKGRFFDGTIHDCKVWNRVLTDEEIAELMA